VGEGTCAARGGQAREEAREGEAMKKTIKKTKRSTASCEIYVTVPGMACPLCRAAIKPGVQHRCRKET